MYALLDVEGVVHVRVVDQALPADRGPRFLEVNPHENEQRATDTLGERTQSQRVLAGGRRIVNRARPYHDEQPRVLAVENPPQQASAAIDEILRRRWQRQGLLDRLGGRQQLA